MLRIQNPKTRSLLWVSALWLLAACGGRISKEGGSPTPPVNLSSPNEAESIASVDEQDCFTTFQRQKLVNSGEGEHAHYTLSQADLEHYLRLMGIKSICIPGDWGAPFINADWNAEADTAQSGRMVSLGFESLYPGAGWSDAAIIYATYDFAAGIEYDVFASEADWDKLHQGTMPGILSVDGIPGFSRPYASIPMGLQWVWQTVVFPFEDSYLAVALRLGAFDPASLADTIADFNEGKFPDDMQEDLKIMDQMIRTIQFSRVEDPSLTFHLVTSLDDPRAIDRSELKALKLQQPPLFTNRDIMRYDFNLHTLELTTQAFERVMSLFTLPIDSNGIPFVVSVSGEPIYTGAFYSPASSISYDGVVILHPMVADSNMITLLLGYPSPEAFEGQDPRSDPRILKALESTDP
jgi:hypothetical protein